MASKRKTGANYVGGVGQKVNMCARNVRKSRMKAVKYRNKVGSPTSKSRPMEFTYRGIPFNTPRAKLSGL